ncbi:hypothetical protein AB6E23_08690 [Vibrio cyclitrophicus]
MENYSNSAYRILNVVKVASSTGGNTPSTTVWANVFGLDANVAKSDPHFVHQKLTLFRGELDLLESAMASTHFSENLYKPYINNVSRSVSVTNIGASWSSYSGYLGVDTILAINYCAEILPKETECDFESLTAILNAIDKLREQVEISDLHSATKSFVLSQISIIERAIQNYPITGVESIRKAFSEGFADICSHAENIQEDDAEVRSQVGEFWVKLRKVGGAVVETDKIASAVVKLVENGGKLSDGIAGLLQ